MKVAEKQLEQPKPPLHESMSMLIVIQTAGAICIKLCILYMHAHSFCIHKKVFISGSFSLNKPHFHFHNNNWSNW